MGSKKFLTELKTVKKTDSDGNFEKQENVSVVVYESEPDYIKVYLDTILYLQNMPQGISTVLKCILQNSSWADNNQQMVIITKPIREMLAKKLNKKPQYIADAITALVKGKLLLRIGSARSACYQVNPYVFGKGRWSDIKRLRLHVDFDSSGTTFWTEVQNFNKKEIQLQHLSDFLDCESIRN